MPYSSVRLMTLGSVPAHDRHHHQHRHHRRHPKRHLQKYRSRAGTHQERCFLERCCQRTSMLAAAVATFLESVFCSARFRPIKLQHALPPPRRIWVRCELARSTHPESRTQERVFLVTRGFLGHSFPRSQGGPMMVIGQARLPSPAVKNLPRVKGELKEFGACGCLKRFCALDSSLQDARLRTGSMRTWLSPRKAVPRTPSRSCPCTA